MGYNFYSVDRDQQFLFPPSLRDWLPADDAAWFVIDAVGGMDLGAFYAKYRPDGAGATAYDPSMMVSLLVYAYCHGERSSRKIEWLCERDVAFRVIAANRAPDHSSICRFRASHEEALGALFLEVLKPCAKAKLDKRGEEETGKKKRGRKPQPPGAAKEDPPKAKVTDPESRIMTPDEKGPRNEPLQGSPETFWSTSRCLAFLRFPKAPDPLAMTQPPQTK